MDCVDRYNGVDYRRQRICDVLPVKTRARWYFAYINGNPTSDHYRTLAEFKASVDNGHFNELNG